MSSGKKTVFNFNQEAAKNKGGTEIRTVLPTGCSVEGKLVCSGPTRLDGGVNGELVADDVLIIDTNASVVANLNVRELVVRGAVKGNVTALDRVCLSETATIEGDIEAPSISIADGAQVKGKVDIRKVETDNVASPVNGAEIHDFREEDGKATAA